MAVKGIVIGEKHSRDETLDISFEKKGKQSADAKKKGSMSLLDNKKKGLVAKTPAKPKATSSRATSKAMTTFTTFGEETSVNPGATLGPNASILENHGLAEKHLQMPILPTNRTNWTSTGQ